MVNLEVVKPHSEICIADRKNHVMEAFIFKPTKGTPGVILDPENGVFEFSKTSIMGNPIDYYLPINRWIDEYSKNPNDHTIVKFNFDFLNSGSIKEILRILSKLEKISHNHPVKVQWHYRKEDQDMLTTSLMFDQILNLDMEFIEC
jgi:hypothetical protein